MGTTKEKFDNGSQERLVMFGPTTYFLPADDDDAYVASVALEGLSIGDRLTLLRQPLTPHSLAFSAKTGDEFHAKVLVEGINAFGESVREIVGIDTAGTETGLVGNPWVCVQTQNVFSWIHKIELVSYTEPGAASADVVVGLVMGTQISTTYYDNAGAALQVQRGMTADDTVVMLELLNTATIAPYTSYTVDQASGRLVVGPPTNGVARLLHVKARPDAYRRSS